MPQASTCAAGFSATSPTEIPSQMTTYDDNPFETSSPAGDGPKDTDVSPILNAELALLNMLARLIVDAVQRHAIQPDANDP
jgi:hypothetical protein